MGMGVTSAQHVDGSCIAVFAGLVFRINCKWIRNMPVHLRYSMEMKWSGNGKTYRIGITNGRNGN